MIAKPSIAFNDFSGTAKEVTARSVHGRNVLSVRAKQSKVVTPSQAISRNKLSKISRAYKQLTDSQMAAWGTLAKHLKGISTLGTAAEMNAHNAFVRINENRQLLGKSLLTDAPEYRSIIPEVRYTDLWVTPSMILFTGIDRPKDSYKLVIKMSAGLSIGISNGWNKTVIVCPGMDDDWGEANITRIYNSTIGFAPQVGDRVFIELYWLDEDTGLSGETTRINAIVGDGSQSGGQTYIKRNQITMDSLSTLPRLDEGIVNSLNVEQANDTPLMTCEINVAITGIVMGFEGNLQGPPDTYVGGRSYFPARGLSYAPYAISLNELYVHWLRFKKSYQIASRYGKYSKDFEMFGTTCMTEN